MIDVSTSIVIHRSRAEVASYAANPENAPKWYVNIKDAVWKSHPTICRGSRVAFVAQFLGRKLEYTYEIVEYVPAERLVMRTAEGPFPMETTYVWQALPDGSTRMTLRNRGMPRGFSRLFAPFIATAVRRATTKDLQSLKAVLERGLA
jgi:hypothetical protein